MTRRLNILFIVHIRSSKLLRVSVVVTTKSLSINNMPLLLKTKTHNLYSFRGCVLYTWLLAVYIINTKAQSLNQIGKTYAEWIRVTLILFFNTAPTCRCTLIVIDMRSLLRPEYRTPQNVRQIQTRSTNPNSIRMSYVAVELPVRCPNLPLDARFESHGPQGTNVAVCFSHGSSLCKQFHKITII